MLLRRWLTMSDSNGASIRPRTSQRMSEFMIATLPTVHTDNLFSVKKYGLNMLVSSDDQVKSYIKRIMSQLNKWMIGGKISKLVVVITSKETGEHVERWQFDVQIFGKDMDKNAKSSSKSSGVTGKENSAANK